MKTPHNPATAPIDFRDWHIPLARDDISLGQALDTMRRVGAGQAEIPLLVQLVENPKYKVPGIELFHGRVELRQHDAIHVLLGRGLLNKDEGFTIGFTMGSTKKVTTVEEELFVTISSNLYPKPYRFNEEDTDVFRKGLRLAYIMDCMALDNIDFSAYRQQSVKSVRETLGIDRNLLEACYRLEKARYPNCPASQRLL